MERPSFEASPRFARRVVSVVGFIPNAPTHRRDTIECKLDCGHTRSVVCLNRGEEAVASQTRRLIGSEIECAKCSVLERIRQKASHRGKPRRIPARSIAVSSRAAS